MEPVKIHGLWRPRVEILKASMKFKGVFELDLFSRDGKFLGRSRAENIITDQGLNHILNVIFHGATQITTWYCVLYESNTAGAAAMTYAVPVYTECTAYDEATRPVYNEAESTAKSTSNSANKAVFTFNATKNIYGASLVGGGTDPTVKGNTAGGGTLICAGLFDTVKPVIATYVGNLTYTVTSADAG